jgi:hypothetical protein
MDATDEIEQLDQQIAENDHAIEANASLRAKREQLQAAQQALREGAADRIKRSRRTQTRSARPGGREFSAPTDLVLTVLSLRLAQVATLPRLNNPAAPRRRAPCPAPRTSA